MSSTTPVYASKALFEEHGFAPSLVSSCDATDCSICLKPLAHELSAHEGKNNLPVAEKPLEFSKLPQPGLMIKACGHVFGSNCIKTWLEDWNSCPMCRKELFPAKKEDFGIDEVLEEFDWSGVVGGGHAPWMNNQGWWVD